VGAFTRAGGGLFAGELQAIRNTLYTLYGSFDWHCDFNSQSLKSLLIYRARRALTPEPSMH